MARGSQKEAAGGFASRASAGQVHLRVLATTDLHAHVLPFDYYSDRPVETAGLARTATLIRAVRAECANTLLLDNGDFLQGTPLGDMTSPEDGTDHPVIAAMNAIGVDAATLGNHEFNFGLEALMAAIAGARFPVVSANVLLGAARDPAEDRTLVAPYTVLHRQVLDGAGDPCDLRIGLIGFAPPQTMIWDARRLAGRVHVRDAVETARARVPQLRAAGADIVIALNHGGIGPAEHVAGMENSSLPLAGLEGIDAILTGHTHQVFPGPDFGDMAGVDNDTGTLNGTPAVMAGSRGSHLGVIDLLLERGGTGWQIATHASHTRPIARRDGPGRHTALVVSDPTVAASVSAAHARTLARVRRPVGRCTGPLFSHFALVADDPTVQIVSRAQRWHVETLLRGTDHAGLPVLSATAPFRTGGRGGPENYIDIPAGEMAIRNIAELYHFPNALSAVRVTGAQIRGWLERSAGMFHQVRPGARDAPLLRSGWPSYEFDILFGLTYEIDPARPPRYGPAGGLADPGAARIRDLCHAGRPVADEMEFVVATSDFRAGGSGGFPGADGSTKILDTHEAVRDVLIRYVTAMGTVDPATEPNWRLAKMPGTTVLFDTGPGAAAHLHSIPGLRIEPAGDGPGGFARFRLHL